MLKTILFVLYAGFIPLVPLWGVRHFKAREDDVRKNVCFVLFIVQGLISAGSIVSYLR